ncbi:XRE family transcriptional regulator [Stackebrandtia nassauensis]|uniref:Transcriptional regulator, XRE family n=1 Tax=Stackebrandtia nassauensis (strain DSM 44728 / CIP 108903 / NRRL B-16338 / NBRC 102104 / LLR-40K-21) TaxID=446470 RepID=D3PUU8_STANL|nr:XRE family transcriptional regulator [Stackebrandtia nassauensis]ADD44972.1 transcriptional regulator, XRE family [Stackebrandtia nassauensis DSM 44728]
MGKKDATQPQPHAPWGAAETPPAAEAEPSLDLISLGKRIRHLRKQRGMTLDAFGEAIGTAPSQLSMIENGKREPKLSMLRALARELGVSSDELLRTEPPNRRVALEIELERAQQSSGYQSLGLPSVRPSARVPTEVLEALVGLHREVERQVNLHAATPEEARRANTELRRRMRDRDNYFGDIEAQARDLLKHVDYSSGPLSQYAISDLASYLGFTLHHVDDLPHSTRSVTDLRNRRIYLTQNKSSFHDPRTVLLQALASQVLEHDVPPTYADFLGQRVATNYLAAALLIPEVSAVKFLRQAMAAKEIAVEDLRDNFAVSYETAAHRFTNLATHHLGIRTHFQKVHKSGTIFKAYENDGVAFPRDPTGAIEGQQICRFWTSRQVFEVPDKFSPFNQYTDTSTGSYWCTARTERGPDGEFSLSVGVPYEASKWFRGKETTARSVSRCPDPECCRRPPRELAEAWAGQVWPAGRATSSQLAAMPRGSFPGVDETEVYRFLEKHSRQ